MKAIEALTTFGNLWMGYSTVKETYPEHYETIEKSLKALEIIKEKRIDIESFYTSFIEGEYDYNFYEKRYGTYGKYCLTEEEFDLLKEVLKCQKE